MAFAEKLYLDTNVFIAAFENKNELSELLTNLFMVDAEKMRFATSELTLSELLVMPYRTADDAAIDLYEGMIQTSEWLELLPVGRQILSYAAVLRSQYPSLKLPDAIHVSTAFAANCSHFLTGDTGLKGTYQIIHSRHGMVRRSKPLLVIRPDKTTLSGLLENTAE
ncbi:PilT domain-containing protein [Rhizobium etli bv. phaseoli str. IE4803]|nr:PilT domain-containing protein [Rhizobium etli bv. phaseoli str. IE4803]